MATLASIAPANNQAADSGVGNPSSDPIAAGRAARAQRYKTQGAGVSQGDQGATTKKRMLDAADKADKGLTQSGSSKAAALRKSAQAFSTSDGE